MRASRRTDRGPSAAYDAVMASKDTIIVGHDGSDFADDALAWALELAQRASLGVHIIRAWSITTAPRPASFTTGGVPPLSDFANAVRERLETDTAPMRGMFADVPVELEAVHSPAANALVDASAGGTLVVVGPRGLGGFLGLVLGSVSEQIVRHARCPVVVVRGDKDAASSERSATLDAVLDD